MSNQNISDLIEQYLKEMLDQAREIEIKRADLADQFDVVPSQINYVIKTRFGNLQGFEVKSKRGGGGYIKIVKYEYSGKHDLLAELYKKVPVNLSTGAAKDILQLLFEQDIITQREGNLLLAALTYDEIKDTTRSQLLRHVLQRIDREENE